MSLNNIELQVVSKYIYNFKDIENLLKINDNLKYNYHSTFEFINLPTYYILTDNQVIKIINKLKMLFPNLKEIILNFNSEDIKIMYLLNFYLYILNNYLKFVKYSNLKIKLDFDFKIIVSSVCLINSDKTFDILVLKEFLKQEIIISPINLIFEIGDDLNINELFELYNKCKYPKLNFILELGKHKFDEINDKYKNIEGFYFTYVGLDIYFNNIDDINNIYLQNYFQQFNLNFINQISQFPLYYELMKCKNINQNSYLVIESNKYIDKILDNLNETINNSNLNYIKINDNIIYTSKNKYYNKYIKITDDIGFYNTDSDNNLCYKNLDDNVYYKLIWCNLQDTIKNYWKINVSYI